MSAAVQAPATACPVCGATAFPDGWDVEAHLRVMHTTAAQDRAAAVFDTLRAAVQRTCALDGCGRLFEPYRTHQRYCSPTCSSRARDRRGTERRNGHIHVEAVCERCGGLYTKRVQAQRFCTKGCTRPRPAPPRAAAPAPVPVPVPVPAETPVPVPLGAGFAPRRASGWPPDRSATARTERRYQCPDCGAPTDDLVHHAAVHHGGPAPARWIDAGDELG